jgi:hypothetical protein
MSEDLMHQAVWMWPADAATDVNRYAEFRHEFVLKTRAEAGAWLAIAADSQYVVWLNGEFVGTGQYTGFPEHAYYNRYELAQRLQPGRNVLAVLAHCCGCNHFSYIPSGQPGVIYALGSAPGHVAVRSGSGDVLTRVSPGYHQGAMPRIDFQLPFTFEFDAVGADGWQAPDYVPTATWRPLAAADCLPAASSRRLEPLPIAHWQVQDRAPVSIVAQGVFRLAPLPDGDASVAARMQRDFLSSRVPRDLFVAPGAAPLALGAGVTGSGLCLRENATAGADGIYLVVDLGREETGFLEWELTAASGAVVDVAYGEHLTSLRVRAEVGGRHFASRYYCRQGRQVFTHWAVRAGGRYLQLHIHGELRGFVLHYAGLRPVAWPSRILGAFASPDRLDRRLFEVGARTLQLCMHEHYEDSPWREQGLYANDSLIQALCGYYALGEYAFPAFSFHLLGKSLQPDGWLELCAPASIPITIPSFCMAWVMALEQHLRYSGDVAAAAAALPVATRMLDGWTAQMQEGLLPVPRGKRYWQFYDWMPGVDGCATDGSGFAVLSECRFDALLNAYFILALEAGAALAESAGSAAAAARWRLTAAGLRPAVHRRFWLADQELYTAFSGPGQPAQPVAAELCQALALCAGVVADPAAASRLRRRLLAPDNGLVPATLSQSLHTLQAVAPDPEYRTAILERLRGDWGDMLLQGATSFWETRKGSWDFDEAGSLCHGWSTLPLFAFGAWLLGIRPLEPGFRSFTVDPDARLAAGTSGRVPTPHGPIDISWERHAAGHLVAHLQHPAATRPVPAPQVALG